MSCSEPTEIASQHSTDTNLIAQISDHEKQAQVITWQLEYLRQDNLRKEKALRSQINDGVLKFHHDKKIQLLQRNVAITRKSKHNKKVADAKAKSISLINMSLLWHFDNKSQIDYLQSQIKHQNNENKRIQLKSNFETSISRCFLNGKMKEINVIQEDLRNTVQVLQNELMEKDSEIHSMKKEQEVQELK